MYCGHCQLDIPRGTSIIVCGQPYCPSCVITKFDLNSSHLRELEEDAMEKFEQLETGLTTLAAVANRLKEPRNMKTVYSEILEHPDYKNKLDDNTRWSFEFGCVGGYSHCTRTNNKWARRIWRHLHWNESLE